MFTKNYITYRRLMFLARDYGSYNNFVCVDGATRKGYAGQLYSTDIGSWMGKGKCQALPTTKESTYANYDYGQGTYFGRGSTAPTKSDYTLEDPITEGLVVTNPSSLTLKDEGNGTWAISADFIVRNSTEEAITIREMGVFTPIGCTNSTSFSSATIAYALMDRTVLETPVTVEPDEARLITYTIRFHQTLSAE